MLITFTGTAGAGGVPRYGCVCMACERARKDPNHIRRPCSALIEADGTCVLLDAGLMDIHDRFPPGYLDSIILTHYHPDHVQGLLHLRWGVGTALPVYGPADNEGFADLFKHPGILEFNELCEFRAIRIGSLKITPLPLVHSRMTLGYAVESDSGARFAYLTDTVGLPSTTQVFLEEWCPSAVALDCSHTPQTETPKNHNDLTLALKTLETLRPERSWLTHISHKVDTWVMQGDVVLPANVFWARDSLEVEL